MMKSMVKPIVRAMMMVLGLTAGFCAVNAAQSESAKPYEVTVAENNEMQTLKAVDCAINDGKIEAATNCWCYYTYYRPVIYYRPVVYYRCYYRCYYSCRCVLLQRGERHQIERQDGASDGGEPGRRYPLGEARGSRGRHYHEDRRPRG